MVRCSACLQETPTVYSHCVHCGAEIDNTAQSVSSGAHPASNSERDLHTLSFHLDDLSPEEMEQLSESFHEDPAEVDSHTLYASHGDVWTQENPTPPTSSGIHSNEMPQEGRTSTGEEKQSYAFRKLKLLKKPMNNRSLFKEQTARKKFDAEEWKAIVAEATQQKVASPVANIPFPPMEPAPAVVSDKAVPTATVPVKPLPGAMLRGQEERSDTAASMPVPTSPNDSNDETQDLSKLKAWVAENQHLFNEEDSAEFPRTTVGPAPEVSSSAFSSEEPAQEVTRLAPFPEPPPEVTQIATLNPFLQSPVGGVFSSSEVYKPAPTEKVDLRSLGTAVSSPPRMTAAYGSKEVMDALEEEELEELNELDELDEDSIIEEEAEALQTQQTPTPARPNRAREATIPGGAFTPLSPFPEASPDPQSTLVHRSPRRHQELIALVLVQLHVEDTQTGEWLHFGQPLSLLDGLSYRLAEVLREAGLHIDVERENQLIAHGACSQDLLQQAFESCQQLFSVVALSQYSSGNAQVGIRCAVTTGEGNRVIALETARASALRLLEVMPSQTIWADSRSWFDLQHKFSWNDFEVQELQLTVHELQIQEHLESTKTPGLTSGELPLLGRQQEWSRLQEQWQQAVHGRSSLVFLVGDSGSGRTRLLEDWHQSLSEPHSFFMAAGRWCPKYNVSSPYLTSLLESHREHQHWSASHELMEYLSELSENGQHSMQGWREYGADLLTFWDNRGLRGRDPVEALNWYIEQHTRQHPVLLVIDDLFLLDRHSHRWLNLLLEKQFPRLMMVVLTSPGEYESRFFQVLQQAVTVELPPLNEQDCLQLIHSVAHEHPEVIARSSTMIRESGGNPRLLLSLLSASFHQDPGSDEETLMDQVAVPSAMEATVLQNLRGLDHLERDTLRKAAVIGERFWKGAIESLERLDLSEGGWGLQGGQFVSRVDDRQETLHKLVRRTLIKPENEPVLGEEVEYHFSQRLLQQVLLRQYPSAIRRKMHKKVAEWLLLRGQTPELARDVAMHLKRAGEVAQASIHLSRAGENALHHHNYSEALRLLREALEDTPEEDSSLRLKLLQQLGQVYRAMGDTSSAIHLYQMALQLSWRLSSFVDGGELYLQLGLCHRQLGQFEQAREALTNGISLLEQVQAQDKSGLVYQEMARLHLLEGKPEEAQLPLQEARKRLDEDNPVHKARFLGVEGHYFRLMAHWARAIQAFQEACRLLRGQKQPLLLARSLAEQGELFLTAGDEDTASQLLKEAAGILREHNASTELIRVLLLGAHGSLLRRDVQTALEWLLEAWELVQRQPDSSQSTEVAAALATAYASALKAREAIHFARIAEKKATQGPLLQQAMIQYYLGQAAATLPANLVTHMLERPPRKLPDGGLATYFFVRGLEMFERCSEKARYCMTLLALGRSLLRGKHQQAAQNVLVRGLREAKTHGLGLWLERLENQLRLVRGQAQQAPEDSTPTAGKDTSTLLVRTPKKRKNSAENKAFESSPEDKMTDEKTPPRRPLNRPLGNTKGSQLSTRTTPRRPTESMGSMRNPNIGRQMTGKSQGIPRPNSPPPGKNRK